MAVNGTMRGVLWEGITYQMSVVDLPIPTIQEPTDVIVRMTAAALCGTDLHVYRGLYGSPEVPWVMGHEGMGYIQEAGNAVSALSIGDYVVIPDQGSPGHLALEPTTGSGFGLGTVYGDGSGCQCKNPNEPKPHNIARKVNKICATGEYVRVPFADDSLIPVPTSSTNNNNNTNATTADNLDYLFLSDIFATGWAALDYANFEPGETVAIFGAGPVGLLSAYSAILRGASQVYAVDHVQERLDLAASIGAVPINFAESDPVEQILRYEPGGVVRSVDCVGFDQALNSNLEFEQDVVIRNMVAVTRVQGGIGAVGVLSAVPDTPGTPRGSVIAPNITFPISDFFDKGLSFRGGGVDPKPYAPQLTELIASGKAHPGFIVSREIGIEEVPEYYERFDRREEVKVMIRFP